jgi:hypothetical protein
MPWYVFALVDAVPSGPPGKGLRGKLSIKRVPGGLAVVERRADIPPAEFGTLQRHQAVVERLAGTVGSILPVRFGTLLDDAEIEEALQDRDDEIAEALENVRDRVQYTWRSTRRREDGKKGSTGTPEGKTESGAEYLRRAARAASPAPPAAFRAMRTALAPLRVAERYQPATAALPEALYHLVDRAALSRYETASVRLQERNPKLTVTGPFPPFAFAADIL